MAAKDTSLWVTGSEFYLQMIEELLGEQRNGLLQGLSCWRTVMDGENSPVQIHLLQNVIVSQQSDELYFLKPTDLLSSGNPAPLSLNWYIIVFYIQICGSWFKNLVLTRQKQLSWELTKSESKASSAPPGDMIQ